MPLYAGNDIPMKRNLIITFQVFYLASLDFIINWYIDLLNYNY